LTQESQFDPILVLKRLPDARRFFAHPFKRVIGGVGGVSEQRTTSIPYQGVDGLEGQLRQLVSDRKLRWSMLEPLEALEDRRIDQIVDI